MNIEEAKILKKLIDLLLDTSLDTDEEVRTYFLEKEEDPDAILNRVHEFINKKEAEQKEKLHRKILILMLLSFVLLCLWILYMFL